MAELAEMEAARAGAMAAARARAAAAVERVAVQAEDLAGLAGQRGEAVMEEGGVGEAEVGAAGAEEACSAGHQVGRAEVEAPGSRCRSANGPGGPGCSSSCRQPRCRPRRIRVSVARSAPGTLAHHP